MAAGLASLVAVGARAAASEREQRAEGLVSPGGDPADLRNGDGARPRSDGAAARVDLGSDRSGAGRRVRAAEFRRRARGRRSPGAADAAEPRLSVPSGDDGGDARAREAPVDRERAREPARETAPGLLRPIYGGGGRVRALSSLSGRGPGPLSARVFPTGSPVWRGPRGVSSTSPPSRIRATACPPCTSAGRCSFTGTHGRSVRQRGWLVPSGWCRRSSPPWRWASTTSSISWWRFRLPR